MSKIASSIALLSFVIINSLCSNSNSDRVHIGKNADTLYRVFAIDSIDNFYVVYAIKEDIKYKIISEKAPCIESEKIQLNQYYNFKLKSRLYDIEGIEVAVGSPVGCVILGKTATKICVEDSIKDLMLATDLIGLCHNN